MFERAVAQRPQTPHLVPDAVRAGARLRKRRRIEAAVGSVAAIAVISAVVAAAAGAFSPAATPPAVSVGLAGSETAYVWTGTNTVTPVRLGTGKVLTPLKVPGVIQDIDAMPDGKAVYVFSNTETSSNSTLFNYVTRINSATGKVGSPIRLTGNSLVQDISEVQIAPTGKFAYVTESGAWPANAKYESSALVAINLATGAQRKLLDTGSFGCVITPDGRTAYEADLTQQVVTVDLVTGSALPPIKLRAPGYSFSVAVAPDGRTAYVASQSSGTTWVTPINTATNIAAKPIEVQTAFGGGPDIAIAPDGKTAYLSDDQYVVPISLAAGTVGKPIRLTYADAERYFEISANSKFGYDMQLRASSVQLISLASGSLLRTVALPGGYRQSAPGVFRGGSTVYVPASIYRGALPSLGALFPVQVATQHVGRPILFPGAPNGVVFVP
jgi:DNA-binding beta-propeller fold protein YncE